MEELFHSVPVFLRKNHVHGELLLSFKRHPAYRTDEHRDKLWRPMQFQGTILSSLAEAQDWLNLSEGFPHERVLAKIGITAKPTGGLLLPNRE